MRGCLFFNKLEGTESLALKSSFINCYNNITKNCIDRHLAKRGEKAAIIFEPNDPNEEAQTITYNELYARVSKMAKVFSKDYNFKKLKFIYTLYIHPFNVCKFIKHNLICLCNLFKNKEIYKNFNFMRQSDFFILFVLPYKKN